MRSLLHCYCTATTAPATREPSYYNCFYCYCYCYCYYCYCYYCYYCYCYYKDIDCA